MNRMNRVVSGLLILVFFFVLFAGCAPKQPEHKVSLSADSSLISINTWDDAIDTTITLTGYLWADQITNQDILLMQAFSDMSVDKIERISEEQLRISAKGKLQNSFSAGTLGFTANALLNPYESEEQNGVDTSQESIPAAEANLSPAYTVDITILHPRADVVIKNTGGKDALLSVKLTDCTFSDTVNTGSFSFTDTQNAPIVVCAVRTDEQTMELTLSSDAAANLDSLYAQISEAMLCISGDALSTERSLQTPVSSYTAQLAVSVDYVEETEDGFLVTLLLSCSNGSFNELTPSQISLSESLGSLLSIDMLDDKSASLKVVVNNTDADVDTLTVDGFVQINGQWGKTLWGSPCLDANLSVHYAAQEASKQLLAIETDLMFDLLKSGFIALATSIGQSSGNRLMEAIDSDLFADETVRQLSDMNKYLHSMDAKWTNILDSVNSHLGIMEDKIGSSNCSRVMDEFDTLSNTLQATVMHLENAKARVDEAEKGTPEYETAKQAYIKAVEKETCKVYTNSYVLGQKVLKGSAGLSSGVVGTYDEMLSLLYNFDTQTYDLKEDFRVMTLALYLKAYDQAVLYYQLTDPDNTLLKQLESQLISISKLLDGMKVVRRTNDNVFCYAAGKTLKRCVRGVLGTGEYVSTQITQANAEKMISRAEYRNTTLGADMQHAGLYSPEKTTLDSNILIVDCVRSKQFTYTKRESWTTMTKVNITTHGIDKNARTYYQLSESPWYDVMWTQKECWGVYENQGFMLQTAVTSGK